MVANLSINWICDCQRTMSKLLNNSLANLNQNLWWKLMERHVKNPKFTEVTTLVTSAHTNISKRCGSPVFVWVRQLLIEKHAKPVWITSNLPKVLGDFNKILKVFQNISNFKLNKLIEIFSNYWPFLPFPTHFSERYIQPYN